MEKQIVESVARAICSTKKVKQEHMLQQPIPSQKQRMKMKKLLMLRMKFHSCVQIFARKKFQGKKVAHVVFSVLAINLYSFIVFGTSLQTSLFYNFSHFLLPLFISLSYVAKIVTQKDDLCNLFYLPSIKYSKHNIFGIYKDCIL